MRQHMREGGAARARRDLAESCQAVRDSFPGRATATGRHAPGPNPRTAGILSTGISSAAIGCLAICATLFVVALPVWAASTGAPSGRVRATAAAVPTATAAATVTPAGDAAPAAEDAAPDEASKTAPKKAKGRSYGIPQIELINEQIRAAGRADSSPPHSRPATVNGVDVCFSICWRISHG